ncbi:MAG TPA: GNAT family N-acetyltransferase [Polyangia bacterium]|jgi:RimJ/RimL family protein N-acetyltransferase|nr:GNAT family N-acetyltransferase [Polyangia bacterium]
MVVLETERLILRHLEPGDGGFILRLLNEPSFLQNIGDKGVRTVEQAVHYLVEGPIKSYEVHGHGLYLVALQGSQAPVGMCGLIKRDLFQDVDLGYAFLPEFWGRGYAVESGAAVLAWGRRTLGLTKVIAVVTPTNAGSIKVLERLGFSFSGFTRMPPDPSDVSLYELSYEAAPG